jgi:hypothetical protein
MSLYKKLNGKTSYTQSSLYRRLKTDEEEEESKKLASQPKPAPVPVVKEDKKTTTPWYKQTGVSLLKQGIEGVKKQRDMTPEERAKNDTAYRTKVGGQKAAYFGSRAEEGLYSFQQGLTNAVATVADNSPIKFIPGAIKALKEPQNRFEKQIQANANENKPVSKGQQIAGDVVSSTTRMIPSILASLVNPAVGMASFAIPAGGQYAREAELGGADSYEQLVHGTIGGATEAIIERIAFIKPLAKLLPDGVLGKVVKNGTANMRKNLLSIGLNAGKAALGEAVEEAVANPLMGLSEKAIYNKDKVLFGKDGVVDLKQMGYDALIGGITGGLFAGANIPFNVAEAKAAKEFIEENYDATLAVAQGLPEEYKSSQKATEYTKAKYPISYSELVDLQKQTEIDLKDYAKKAPKETEQPVTATEVVKPVTQPVATPVDVKQKKAATLEPQKGVIDEAETELQNAITTPRPQAEIQKNIDELKAVAGDKASIKAVNTAEQVKTPTANKMAQKVAQEVKKPIELTKVKPQEDYPGAGPKQETETIEDIEEEFFGKGSSLLKINLQKFAEKMRRAQNKLAEEFKKEKAAIRWLAKEKQSAALDKLSQKYDTKIDKLNKLLDAEKYKGFWKNELDKKDLRGRIDKLRTDKNDQIAVIKKGFSEKLKDTKKQYTLKKTDAINKLKEKTRDKAAENKAKAAERAEINKKFDKLRSLDLKHMRPEYRKQIEFIFSMFDTTAKSHSVKKLAELQKLKQYIEDNPENNIPESLLKQLDMLSKKTVSQITKEEFDNIYDAVMHLAHLEKLKNKLIMKERYRDASEVADEATGNVLENRKIKIDPESIDTNKPEFSRNFVKEFFHQHLTPETLSLMSDQRSKGIIKRLLFNDMYEGHSQELRYRHEAYAIFEKFLGGLGGEIRSWSRSFNKTLKSSDLVEVNIKKQHGQLVSKIRITKAERLYLYIATSDADAKRSMLRGGVSFGTNLSQVVKLTEGDLTSIAEGMSSEEKQFAELVTNYFVNFARPRMNEVFLELNGYELIPQKKGYIPIKRHKDFLDRDYLKMRNKSTNVSLEGMGVLKERVKSSSPIVADDIFRVLVEHIEKVSAYTGLAKPLRNAKMLLENPKLKNAYRQVGMYNIHVQLANYIKDVENKSVDLEFLDKLGYTIQNKFASSVLGLNPFTILKQFTAYVLESNEISPKYLLKAQFTKSAFDEIIKYSPILAERAAGNVSLELGEIGKVARIRRLFGNYKDIPQLLTKGIVAADRQIMAKTWNAVKMAIKEKNSTLTEKELLTMAARKTEEIVRHTNSASTLYDRSAIGRSKSLAVRAATMFTSQTNIMFNSAVQATLEYGQSEKTAKDFVKATKKLATILVLANLIEQAIDRLRDKIKGNDEEEWNVPMDIVEGILNQVYFVGKAFSAYRSKVKSGKYFGYNFTVPQLQIVEQVINYATDITNLVKQVDSKERYKSGENKGKLKWKKTLTGITDETFSVLSKLAGLPYDSVKSLIEGIAKKD